uniref:NB-ARC domain-containing protein n=1 Tax=Bionectria ochroleuca TaxID=29856 RepID=A0A8H7TQA7_BIOOC
MSSRQWAGEADPWSELNMNWKKLMSESDQVLVSLRNMADLAARESMVSHTSAIAPNTISIENVQFPVFVLPIPENPGFFGRRDILERINNHLNPSKKQPGFRCYTVYGTGGVGKTQVALAYVYQHRDSYDAIFWINSESKVSIRQSFLEIALSLQLPGVNQRDNAEQVREAVETWFRTTSQNWLLVFDNVESWDNILNYWPHHPGSAIITSRDYRLAGRPASEGEQLDTFSDRESFDFFKSSVESWSNDDSEEAHAAKKLLTELDGLPLAIDQIAGLIKLYEMSVQEFLELYEEESAVLHSERGIGSDIFYPKSLDMVWKELFEPASHFQLPEHLKFCRTQLGLLKEIQKLRGAALIKKTSRSLQIHRLTQNLFIQHAETSTINEIFFSASLLFGEAFPKQRKGDPMFLHETDEVESCGKLLEAAYLGCELYRGDKAELDIVKSHLLNTDALIAWQSLDYKRTEETMQQAVDIRIKRLSPDDDRIVGCINNLGNLCAAQGSSTRLLLARGNFGNAREKLSEAETYLKDETMSMMPLWVAAGEFIAGDIHNDLKEFAEAKSRYQRALELREKHQPGDATVAATAYKLASVKLQLGETREAKNLLTSGLSIVMRKKSQGNTGRILELLEQTAAQENDSQSATSYHTRINAIRESMDVIYGQVTFDGFSFFDPYISFFDR